jgi:hypothetical protein
VSYHRQSRRRGNGYGIIITGYAGDAHYDQVGDPFQAEALRADNLRLMDEDMANARRTLLGRVPFARHEESLAREQKQIAADSAAIRAQLEANSIVNEDEQLKFPVDPGRDTLGIIDDAPTMPEDRDLEAIRARNLRMQATQRLLEASKDEEFRASAVTSPGSPALIQRVMEEEEMRADDLALKSTRMAIDSAAQAQAAHRSLMEGEVQPVAAEAEMQGLKAQMSLHTGVPVRPRPRIPAPNGIPAMRTSAPAAIRPGLPPHLPEDSPLQPVQHMLPPPPKKPSVLPIVGAGLLALFFLRK